MATPYNFAELYKTIAHTELLRIIDNPEDHQPLAVEAARNELLDRRLSDEEIQLAKAPLISEQLRKEQKSKKAAALENKVKAARDIFVETVMPDSSGIVSTEKTIRLFIIVFAGLFLYFFIGNFRSHLWFIKDIPTSPLVSLVYFIPLTVLPVAVYFIWKRKKTGWILMVGFLTFAAIESVGLLVQSIQWEPSRYSHLDDAFRPPPPLTCILRLLFYGGALYMLCKENLREVFSITATKMMIVAGLSAAITFFLMANLFL